MEARRHRVGDVDVLADRTLQFESAAMGAAAKLPVGELGPISAAAGLVSNVLDLVKYEVAIDGHIFVRAETQERA
jgi:hypothetical protein